MLLTEVLFGRLSVLGVGRAGAAPGFLPSDIAGLRLWLGADAIVGLNDGDLVSPWNDQSGQGNNFAKANPDQITPAYKVSILNGKPVVRFNGISDYLNGGNPTSLQINDPLTFFVVYVQRGAPYGYPGLLAHGPDGWAFGISNGSGNVGKFFVSKSGSAPYLNSVTVLSNNIPKLLEVKRSGANTWIYVNGVQESTFGATPNFTFNNNVGVGSDPGSGGAINGDIAEVIVYNSALSDSDRQAVDAYLNAKYAIYEGPILVDDFNRPDALNLGPNWAASFIGGALGISQNKVYNVYGSTAGHTYSAQAVPSDQFSEIEVPDGALDSGAWIGPVCRCPGAGVSADHYLGLYWNDGSTHRLMVFKYITNGYPWIQLGSSYELGASPLPAGTKLRLVANGTTISFRQDGIIRISVTDTSLSTGQPGVEIYDGGRLDNWRGGAGDGA